MKFWDWKKKRSVLVAKSRGVIEGRVEHEAVEPLGFVSRVVEVQHFRLQAIKLW
jgi:hypothetical protein